MLIKFKIIFIFLLIFTLSVFGQEAKNIKVESKHPYSSDKPLREPTIFDAFLQWNSYKQTSIVKRVLYEEFGFFG